MTRKFFYVIQENRRSICYGNKFFYHKTFAFFSDAEPKLALYSPDEYKIRYKINNLNKFLKLVFITEVNSGIYV